MALISLRLAALPAALLVAAAAHATPTTLNTGNVQNERTVAQPGRI